jgi:hypothetical protein
MNNNPVVIRGEANGLGVVRSLAKGGVASIIVGTTHQLFFVIAGHSPSKAGVNALMSRQSP